MSTKIKLQILNRFTGSVIFEYEKEDNTISETVKEYISQEIKKGVRSADLRYADLSSADLRSADLRYADLSSADLRSANLRSANLRYADLSSAVGSDYAIALTRICPDGDIIGWKKCQNNVIVKLLIPKEAKRNNAFGRKCRAEFANVLEIFGADKAISKDDPSFIYEVGKRVSPTQPFNEEFTDECSSGIHFFITRLEAENY